MRDEKRYKDRQEKAGAGQFGHKRHPSVVKL